MAHEELKKLYAIDAEYSDKPWEKWEYKHTNTGEWFDCNGHITHRYETTDFRRKQPEKDLVITIKAGDRWTSEPPLGASAWVTDLDGGVIEHFNFYWQSGQLFKTKEAGQAFADALKIK